MQGVYLHGLSMVDAALMGLVFMEKAYPDQTKRLNEYKRLAASAGIVVEEDPELARERHRAMMAQVEADFGGDL